MFDGRDTGTGTRLERLPGVVGDGDGDRLVASDFLHNHHNHNVSLAAITANNK